MNNNPKGSNNSRFIDRTGEVHLNKQGCTMKITECFSSRNCTIQFNSDITIKNVNYNNIKRGTIKNPFHPSVYEKGFFGIPPSDLYNDITYRKPYFVWSSMLGRCYNKKTVEAFPTYVDTSVCPEWLNFQVFVDWFKLNYNPEIMKDWQLDKDVILKGNKVYSPKTCCFVPKEINTLFISCGSSRGVLPIGVTKNGKKYNTKLSKLCGRVCLGTFNTPEEAFQTYKIAKEKYIKEVAEKWKDKITEQVYQAMINYKVEITD